jgi:aspartyl-tRNA(Asn)/glutamyl-tRNA(Gln) amidotransferase subunit A
LYDATVVTRLKEVKAILIGKTTLDELAMGGTGMTGHKGVQTNPYDPSRLRQVGGSSSGSAIVVADAIVPFAIGSDTGDSVRKPASYTGLVGFKPTWGRISRYGLFPFAPSLDHVAYFTRSVDDAHVLTVLLSGMDENDATSRDVPKDLLMLSQPSSQKIAVIKSVLDSISNVSIKQQFLASIDALRQRGHTVDIIDFPPNLLQAIYPTYMTISCAEATSNNANLDGIKFGPGYDGKTYQDVMIQARTNGFSELIKRRFVIGSFVLMRENQDVLFLRAQRVRRIIVNALTEVYQTYDAIYLPSAPTVAPLLKGSTDRLSNEYLIADSHLALGNFAGLPSITVPLGFDTGLPFGGNVMTRRDEESRCLALALALEQWTGLYNVSTRNRGRTS